MIYKQFLENGVHRFFNPFLKNSRSPNLHSAAFESKQKGGNFLTVFGFIEQNFPTVPRPPIVLSSAKYLCIDSTMIAFQLAHKKPSRSLPLPPLSKKGRQQGDQSIFLKFWKKLWKYLWPKLWKKYVEIWFSPISYDKIRKFSYFYTLICQNYDQLQILMIV